jgi:hypothetical protein
MVGTRKVQSIGTIKYWSGGTEEKRSKTENRKWGWRSKNVKRTKYWKREATDWKCGKGGV